MVDPYRAELDDLRSSFKTHPTKVSVRGIVGPLPQSELTHGIYPYPARLVRHIPRLILPSLVEELGEQPLVLDPFCGSGTVLLEANRIGADAYGVDANPVAALVSRVKTTPVDGSQMTQTLDELFKSARALRRTQEAPSFLRRWYDVDTLANLQRLFSVWKELPAGSASDLAAVVLARRARTSSLMDPNVPVPVRRRTPPAPPSAKEFWEGLESSAAFVIDRAATLGEISGRSRVLSADARRVDAFADLKGERVSVMTSPPYGAAQKYARSTSIEAVWLGYSPESGPADLSRRAIGRERLTASELKDLPTEQHHGHSSRIKKLLEELGKRSPTRAAIYAHYFADMRRALRAPLEAGVEIVNVCLVAGSNTVAGQVVETHRYLAEIIESQGFVLRYALEDEIRGRALLTSRRGANSPLTAEHIYVFGKDSND